MERTHERNHLGPRLFRANGSGEIHTIVYIVNYFLAYLNFECIAIDLFELLNY